MTEPRQVRVLSVVGTRPEAIKMAPVIQRLAAHEGFESRVLATAQHRHMLDQVLAIFGIVPDLDLDIMRPNQDLATLTSRLISELDAALAAEAPDLVRAQGDTTTVMAAALACFYRR
ncbi:MAG: UDP-N-acetylglucosamine 2-epimerase, partial [Thiohalocapsa sp.]